MTAVTVATPSLAPSTGSRRILRQLRRDPTGMLGATICTVFLVTAALAPLLAPNAAQGRGATHVATRELAPSWAHLFGTDHLGRDLLSRVLLGARPALGSAAAVVALAVLIGVPIGLVAGFRGGVLGELLMRITDLFLSFPPLLLAMVIAALLGPSLLHAAIALAISWWPWYARLTRSVTQSLRRRAVHRCRPRLRRPRAGDPAAARPAQRGDADPRAGDDRRRHRHPRDRIPLVPRLGVKPPTPDWGLMVADGRTTVLTEWWIAMFPGLAIFVAALG